LELGTDLFMAQPSNLFLAFLSLRQGQKGGLVVGNCKWSRTTQSR
jgi:hypothetical protein